MVKELLFVPLFETFIRDTANGKRRKLNGERIKPQSVKNYSYILKLLQEYESFCGTPLRIKTNIRNNVKLLLQERNYWKNFYQQFSDFLYHQKGYYDNFTGSVFKIVKAAFSYLIKEKCLPIQECSAHFYVRWENIKIITLLPEQLCFLIMDKDFEQSLSRRLQKIKDMFVFGCTAALRYSDLMSICVKDIEEQVGGTFLRFNSVKTNAEVTIKLPDFACVIFKKYAAKKVLRQRLFSKIRLSLFNNDLKALGSKAGFTNYIGKYRNKNGDAKEIKPASGELFRFCDLLSSHVMRRTGITVLLMLDMPEHLVRKISGHTANSTSFFRYVNFAQSYISTEIDKAHHKLLSLYKNVSQ
jgi:site-specific recombinase XerD